MDKDKKREIKNRIAAAKAKQKAELVDMKISGAEQASEAAREARRRHLDRANSLSDRRKHAKGALKGALFGGLIGGDASSALIGAAAGGLLGSRSDRQRALARTDEISDKTYKSGMKDAKANLKAQKARNKYKLQQLKAEAAMDKTAGKSLALIKAHLKKHGNMPISEAKVLVKKLKSSNKPGVLKKPHGYEESHRLLMKHDKNYRQRWG